MSFTSDQGATATGRERPVDRDPAAACYHIALAWEDGDDLETIAAALAERFGSTSGVDYVIVASDPAGAEASSLLAAWDERSGRAKPPSPTAVPADPDDLAAALGLPGAAVVALTARGIRVGTVVAVGNLPEDRRVLESLATPAGLVLDAALRAHRAAGDAARKDRLSSLTRDLMSIVSHELRTPLTSIIGSLQTLQRTGVDPSSPEGRRLIDSALARTRRLRELVEDLMITTQPETPVRSKLRAVDPGAALRSAVSSVPGAGGIATIDLDPALGPVLVDGPNLERVLVNLLDNAVRHGGDGPVELDAHRDGAIVAFRVVDHGPGLPRTIARAVLDRHIDSADSTLRPAGPGLGLTITKGLVEGLGGSLRHEQTPGGGATFVVEIPFRDGR